ncbi:hypothetical protein [Natrialba asiatica]|uniref:Uncharacterized protein n=1 Tax=Natrialba asiatica (strain ATCC 700177 / DSM 12278 / JCM 9576 / FERM P-10747 / NBRC 102637 / 172P1) TaxID=29540 RepID=M0AL89_NATA1|nr:hypothetical protein [Natrialba asiatica]ELY99480.1 hypothetical protein C481_14643 [Natrialba asiatica DSM 12278]
MASYETSTATTISSSASTGTVTRTASASRTTPTNAGRPSAARAGSNAGRETLTNAGRPSAVRSGNDSGRQTLTNARKPVLTRSSDSIDDPTTSNAVLVPGDFRGVTVVVVDPDGEPLEDLEQLLVLTPFPSSTSIDENGVGQLPMLSTTYTEFRGLAPRGDDVGYMWYEGVKNVVGPQDDEAVIVLDPTEIKGMYAGNGVNMGGPLR